MLGLLALTATATAGHATLGWRAPEQVDILQLAAPAPPAVACALQNAHALAQLGVGYRAFGLFGRSELDRVPFAQSCSELVYYAYARCGVELGDEHQRTRLLAYQTTAPYPEGMQRLGPDVPLQVGDLLVYHRDQDVVEREVARQGRARPGHVVILVSLEDHLVIGAHGRESSPGDAPSGVGYRVLRRGFGRWDGDRTLRAVYRPIASSAGLPPIDPAPTSTVAED